MAETTLDRITRGCEMDGCIPDQSGRVVSLWIDDRQDRALFTRRDVAFALRRHRIARFLDARPSETPSSVVLRIARAICLHPRLLGAERVWPFWPRARGSKNHG